MRRAAPTISRSDGAPDSAQQHLAGCRHEKIPVQRTRADDDFAPSGRGARPCEADQREDHPHLDASRCATSRGRSSNSPVVKGLTVT